MNHKNVILNRESVIYVIPGEKRTIDFSINSAIYTNRLEACVAIGGVNGDQGALMHLTQISPIQEFMNWFYGVIPPAPNTKLYMVGGMKGRAEHFVDSLTKRLANLNYNHLTAEVLTDCFIDMLLQKEEVNLLYLQQTRKPSGELLYVPVGSRKLKYQQ